LQRKIQDDLLELKMLNILLSGPGLMGTQHARLIRARPDCRLTAIVAPNTKQNADFAESVGAAIYPEIEEALQRHQIDGAIVSSPNEFHYSQATACINYSVPAIIEKPITDNVTQALQLAETSERRGVPLMVGHHRAYSPLLPAADSFLQSQAFGKLVALTGTALFYKPAGYFADGPWRTRAGGGPILINLIHEIGLMRHFAGEIISVSAFASHDTRNFEVEDSVAISLRFENGAVGTFLLSDTAASSKSWEMTSGENPVYPYYPKDNCWHFAGTHGSLDFPSMKAWTYKNSEERSWRVPFDTSEISYKRLDPLKLQLDHFLDVLQGNASPRVSARDGYRNLLAATAIQRSIQTEKIIFLSEI
jgi:predicted dehydrogenase